MTHESNPTNVSRIRRILVNLGLVALLAGAAFEMLTGGEHWPFSSYPMFSKVRREARVVHHALVAVPRDGGEEFPLYKSEHIHPFQWYRHRQAFSRMLERSAGEAAARSALADALARYEHARADGRHDGPPLDGVRLYRVEWAIDPRARDLIGHEERTLVAEVSSAEGSRKSAH